MQITSRFTMAIHLLTAIEVFKEDYKVTSDFLASSINTNPVVVRRLLQQLKAAGLIEVARGTGGTTLSKAPKEITLFDVYKSVDCVENGELFHFHDAPNQECPVGRNIHAVLDGRLRNMQEALENEMKRTSLADLLTETEKLIEKQK